MRVKTITQTAFIQAPPLEVYRCFADPKLHSQVTGSKATGNAKEGSKFTAWDGYISGRNLKLVEGKKIVQEWKTSEWPEFTPPSIFTLDFIPKKGGTEIRMVHSKVPAEQAAGYEKGWKEFYWDPLKAHFAKK
ncbi:MAG: SRPBCC domain-containing protein [Candidatus Micrarchaeota archaeon]